MKLRLNSLAARLIATAAIWTLLGLMLGGLVLSAAFRSAAQDNFDTTLRTDLDGLIVAAQPDAEGGVVLEERFVNASFHRFFGQAASRENVTAYQTLIRPHLDDPTRRYWEGRDVIGRRRIHGFAHGLYKRGLLGGFIGMAHLLARAHGIDPRALLEARSLEEQRAIFDRDYAPFFDKGFVRWLTGQPASLFGLGIPPAQYEALAGGETMAKVLRERLERLACHFDIRDNYFAWQAFGRGYGASPSAPLPPYLQRRHYKDVVARVDRVEVRHASFTDYLSSRPDASLDRYVLLDAQDWMTDAQLGLLWQEITRTARPGARVLFRTAGAPTILPGRVPDATLGRWDYAEAASRNFTGRDRSSIYGGVHLYLLGDRA